LNVRVMERSSDGHLAAETAERARIAQDYRVGAFKDDQPLASLIARLTAVLNDPWPRFSRIVQ
jgi:hypothetical protein